ncbi:MAG: FG-GAP-like repeat-containing protein [Bryobacteraceae bacterium]
MLDNGGSKALFSSYLGPASGKTEFDGVAAGASGAIYVTGNTTGSGYPLQAPVQSSLVGEYGAVVSEIQPSAACTYSVSPTALPDTPLGASPTYTITVTAPAGCVWNAVNTSSHMHLVGPDSTLYLGSGNGSVQLAVYPYAGGPDVTAEAVVAGQRVATTLKGSCTINLSPSEIDLALSGGFAEFHVATGMGCAWAATTSNSWITIEPAGSSIATLGWVEILATPSATPRDGTISVNGVSLAVHQSASGTSVGVVNPAPGSQLTGPTVTFGWTLRDDYLVTSFCVGGAPASCSSANVTLGSSFAYVNGLPTDGSTLYAVFSFSGSAGSHSLVYTYTAAVGVPNPPIQFDPVTPSGSIGTYAAFTFEAWDAQGSSDLTEIYAWFTPSLGAAGSSNTCMLRYEPKTNLIYLQGDDGKSWKSASIGSPTGGTLANSQCSVIVGVTSIYGAGNMVTIQTPVTFQRTFAGLMQIGMYGVGGAGDSGPWQNVGNWTVPSPPAPPTNVSVTPNSGSGTSGRFVFQFATASGFSSLGWVWMWFKTGPAPATTADLTNTCLISYFPSSNVFSLYSDSANLASGGVPGGAGHVENSRCSLNNHTSAAVVSGVDLTVTLDLTFFTPLFAGPQNIWMRAVDGEADSGLQEMGTWTVASTSGITLATSPNPSTFGQAVTLTATGAGGSTGKVTFYDGVTLLGTATIASGAAALSTILLPAGKQELKAYYSGDSGNPAATSNIVVQTVNAGGASGLTAGGAVALPSSPSAVTIADFNEDGKADLAVATSTGVSVLLGNGDGTFRTAGNDLAGAQPSAVAAGDFNGDGWPDLAVADLSSGDVSILLGDGAGGFLPAVSYAVGSQPRFVAIGDFNGDGKADLAVANSGSDNVSLLLGNGDGTFGPAQTFPAGSQPYSVAVGDFNDDGQADLAVADSGAGCVSILLGNGDGTFRAPVSYAAGANPHALGVFYAVGYAEAHLAVANFLSGNVSILGGAGDGTFGAPQNYAVGAGASSLAVADFDGDGNPDIATADFLDGGVELLMNIDSPPPAVRKYSLGHGPISVAVADFDGDGRTDMAVADATDHVVNILLSGGCTYSLSSSGHSLDAYGYAVGPGMTFNVNVSAPTCPWSAIPTVTWLTATPASGAGNGTVDYYVYPNSAATPRTGTIVVAGQTFTVTQAGLNPTGCLFYLDSTSGGFPDAGGSGQVHVTLGSVEGCSWVVSSDSPWITITSAPTFAASGNVLYSVAANSTGVTRTGTLTIAGQTFTVTQVAGCSFSLDSTSASIPWQGGQTTVNLTASDSSCPWTSYSTQIWAQRYPQSGTGSASIQLSVNTTANTGGRSATIYLGGQAFTITQDLSPAATQDERFVDLMYFGFLGRLPTSTELSTQLSGLSGGSISRTDVAVNLFNSDEFNNAGRFVAGLYVGILGRDAEYTGWIFQRAAYLSGVATQAQLVTNFLNSTEYQMKYGTPTDDQFVLLLYQNLLRRTPTAAEEAAQLALLSSGTSRTQVAMNLLNGAEFRADSGPELTAFLQYACLLVRDAEQWERDYWANLMSTNALTVSQVFYDFINSAEMGILLQ